MDWTLPPRILTEILARRVRVDVHARFPRRNELLGCERGFDNGVHVLRAVVRGIEEPNEPASQRIGIENRFGDAVVAQYPIETQPGAQRRQQEHDNQHRHAGNQLSTGQCV